MTSAGKTTGRYVARSSPRTKAVARNSSISILIIIASQFITLTGYYYKNLVVFFGMFIAFAILLFTLSIYYYLPASFSTKKPLLSYSVRSLITLLIAFVPCVLLSVLLIHDLETSITYAFLIAIFQFTVTLPVSWYWYKRIVKTDKLIFSLQEELGQSVASFDFLRSQINPHFLFNALNTIYGTALQEGAGRTSHGIEQLADMMRFMLHENLQKEIPLSKELDYVRHYIELQKLRTAPHPSVSIDTVIPDRVEACQIAPMLLIPFVENAFKHGISFREPSFINLSVEIQKKTVQFRLSNSIHLQSHDNPEKYNTGVGLNNVKQRLDLLYPKKHELSIATTAKEFSVHLNIHLD
jgi:two-component system, LytTR family, sensor kinase